MYETNRMKINVRPLLDDAVLDALLSVNHQEFYQVSQIIRQVKRRGLTPAPNEIEASLNYLEDERLVERCYDCGSSRTFPTRLYLRRN